MKGLAVLLLAALAALFVVVTINSPTLYQFLANNSDLLLVAELAENLSRDPVNALYFELPRVPSLFPDILIYLLLSFVLPSWQPVAFSYAILSFVGFVAIAGAVVSRIAERSLAAGLGAFFSVSALAISADLAIGGTQSGFVYIFAPVNHSGSFAISLVALLLARRSMLQPSLMVQVGLLTTAALGTVSDLLFIGSFLLPLLGASALRGVLKDRIGKEASTLIWAAAGCLAGIVLDRCLFSGLLLRQPTPSLNISTQLHLIPEMLRDASMHMAVCLSFFVAVLPATWRTKGQEQTFWWYVASLTALGFLGLHLLLYTNPIGTRYAQPIWWWAAIFVSATVLRLPPKLSAYGSWAMGIAGSCIVASGSGILSDPAPLLHHKNPIAACLAPRQERGIIHAGLGAYWVARPIAAASLWSLQIENITSNGHMLLWGNNRLNYLQDKRNPEVAPLFDFVVMKGLDPAAIRARFGAPETTIECSGTAVWLYSGPGGVGAKIGGIGPALDSFLAASHCFLPHDFMTHTGVLSPAGVELPASAAPREIATWGPYARLKRGKWQFEFRYSLRGVSTGAEAWDIVTNIGSLSLARGRLERTGSTSNVVTVPLNLANDATSLEFRTFLQPGDHLRIEGLQATRAGSLPIPCPQ